MSGLGADPTATAAYVPTSESGMAYHDALGPVRYRVQELGPHPDTQVGITINLMRRLVREDAQCPEFRQHAREVIGDGSHYEQARSMSRAYEHVGRVMTFARDEAVGAGVSGVGGLDPADIVEVIIRPVDMMKYAAMGKAVGDCDDHSMYLACLLECAGVEDVRFVTVAADGRAPEQFSHVYVVAYPDGIRTPLDASHGKYVGWETDNKFNRREEWPIRDGIGVIVGRLAMVAGVGAVVWWAVRGMAA
jgi:hypothetical protein